MASSDDFDLVVVGSGSAARAIVYPCRQAGWKVAIAEARELGGTCALRGCDPKKVLVGVAEIVDWERRMQGRGVSGECRVNWPELMAFKRTFTRPYPDQMRARLEQAGIAVLTGTAEFTGRGEMQVGDRRVSARHFVIASGARPAPLNIPGEELVITSDDFLDLESLPRRIVFIGGGYIAFEFAHVAARAGAQVTIAHRGERALQNFDADLVKTLCEFTRSLGIDIRLNAPVVAVERDSGALRVRTEKNGTANFIEADAVVHAAGRSPNIESLQLDRGGIEYDPRRGVSVNEYLQSVSNRNVWAAGDSAGTDAPRLTPVSGLQGDIVTHNLLHQPLRKFENLPVPTVVYTIPPLASVGPSEEQARRSGARVSIKSFDTSGWYTSRRLGEPTSAAKIIIDETTDQIVGAHLLGQGAEDVINIFATAMRCRMPSSELKKLPFAYPTKSSDLEYIL